MASASARKIPFAAAAHDRMKAGCYNPVVFPGKVNAMFDRNDLLELARTSMPFGKYQGWLLIDLPEPYLIWFADHGFPEGRLGGLLALALEIKINGLEYLLKPLKPPKPPGEPRKPRLYLVEK